MRQYLACGSTPTRQSFALLTMCLPKSELRSSRPHKGEGCRPAIQVVLDRHCERQRSNPCLSCKEGSWTASSQVLLAMTSRTPLTISASRNDCAHASAISPRHTREFCQS